MTRTKDPHYYRVVCSSGDVFYTSAKTAVDFVLDPAFIQFLLMSILFFTSLMLALGLPAAPQIILFGVGLVTTFVWLIVSIAINMLVVNALRIKTLYTPFLLLPALVINTFTLNYVLEQFGTSYIEGFDGFWELAIRTLIIVVCLDIFHTRFVAPQHRLTLTLDENGQFLSRAPEAAAPTNSALSNLITAPSPAVQSLANAPVVVYEEATLPVEAETPAAATTASAAKQEVAREVIIGKVTVDLTKIQYIKSEDHYLILQNADQTGIVRGRLREVVDEIDAQWGLQINRSAWISYAAISEVQDLSARQLKVLMKDGTTFKVANSRKLFFEHGCAQYAPKVVRRRGVASEG